MQDIRAHAPYDQSVEAYLKAGWLFPLPAGGDDLKQPIETGYSGWKNDWKKQATKVKAREILARRKGQGLNIALWLPPGIIGIDVDAYKKAGNKTLGEMQAEFGKLPDTIVSSARADGLSGIRYYRVPLDLDLHGVGIIGEGIDAVHRGTRIAVVPPSYHIGVEDHYKWYLPGEEIDGTGSFDVPDMGEAKDLAPAWVEMFRNRKFGRYIPQKEFKGGIPAARKAVDKWVEDHGGDPCSKMLRVAEEYLEAIRSDVQRHENATMGSYRLACVAAEGHSGLDAVLEEMWLEFQDARGRDDMGGRGPREEWLRFLDGGVRKVMTREDAGEFTGYSVPCKCAAVGPDGRPRPDLNVNEIDAPVDIPACYKAMAARPESNWHGLYSRGGRPFKVDAFGSHEMGVDEMREEVPRFVHCYKLAGTSDEPRMVPQMPPSPFLASMVVSRAGQRELPELLAVKDTPFFANVNGKPKLIHERGYHADARVYLDMDPQLTKAVEHMHERPTTRDLKWSKDWLAEIFAEFPFETDADRATVYAALLLPFVRDLIEGPTPLHLFDAPVEGTGKSLLAEVVSIVACGGLDESHGRFMFGMPKGSNREEELEKKFTSFLRRDPKVLQIDNVSGVIDSQQLALITTTEHYSGRKLGKSDSLSLPNRCTWLLTGNNFTASGEVQRRIVPCRIDAHLKDPAGSRRFAIEDLRGHVRENRARLVWAALTFVAKWIQDGMPSGISDKPKMGSHAEWERVIAGILKANGINGFLSNLAEFRASTKSDYHSIVELLEAWEGRYGLGVKVTSRELIGALDIAKEMVEGQKGNKASNLGSILSKYKDVPQGRFIVKMIGGGGYAHWRLEEIGKPTVVKRGRPPRLAASPNPISEDANPPRPAKTRARK